MSSLLSLELQSLLYDTAIHQSQSSYRKLFGFLFTPVFRLSYAMLKSREQAEEVASDVMFKVWQNRKELINVENLRVYVLVIARNQSLNLLKANSKAKMISIEDIRAELNPVNLTPEQILINSQSLANLENAIEALPTRCRLVFKLTKEEGLTYREVAEVLNISSKTVDAHLVTAMKKLSETVHFMHKKA